MKLILSCLLISFCVFALSEYVEVLPDVYLYNQTIEDSLNFGANYITKQAIDKKVIPPGNYSIANLTKVEEQALKNGVDYRFYVTILSTHKVNVTGRYTVYYRYSNQSFKVVSQRYNYKFPQELKNLTDTPYFWEDYQFPIDIPEEEEWICEEVETEWDCEETENEWNCEETENEWSCEEDDWICEEVENDWGCDEEDVEELPVENPIEEEEIVVIVDPPTEEEQPTEEQEEEIIVIVDPPEEQPIEEEEDDVIVETEEDAEEPPVETPPEEEDTVVVVVEEEDVDVNVKVDVETP